jgi:hypothetical protein
LTKYLGRQWLGLGKYQETRQHTQQAQLGLGKERLQPEKPTLHVTVRVSPV